MLPRAPGAGGEEAHCATGAGGGGEEEEEEEEEGLFV
jgi:hypothetical protein